MLFRLTAKIDRNLLFRRTHLRYFLVQAFLIFFVIQTTNAQLISPVAEKTADSLLNAGNDTVIIFYSWRNSNYMQCSDSSTIENKCYLLAKRTDVLIIYRITEEIRWEPRAHISTMRRFRSQDSLGIFNYLKRNFEQVVSDTLLPGLIKYHINNRDTLISSLGSHPSWSMIVVKTLCGTYRNQIYSHDLDDGIIRNEDGSLRRQDESVNYLHNVSTAIYKMIRLLEALVDPVEKNFE